MIMKKNWNFIAGAFFTFLVAVYHVAVVIGGADWYRASGAGEELAAMAEAGSLYPPILGSILVLIFLSWSFYALSGAGIILRLPFLKFVLIAISTVFIIRGVYGFFVPVIVQTEYVASMGTSFWVGTSLMSLIIGLSYLTGLRKNWAYIAKRSC